ncbi:hypothetical protein KDJ56_07135 [Brevibacillus composti]|uniref:Uncharacterized protein n=1 Tax=Brevibacillus composti TaxID=2796470 RepID=A0A7T5JPW0_9BACL|nr:hypothetical protein [Brevibacillus composti]QQE75704.1 hypothetical protein JD108_07455 [Brevibacillus composti]QUO42730.1 hypothetical protein KDJ56_07135 [Brevibacillus composti]
MDRLKLLLCHTEGFMRGNKTSRFCRPGIYYPIVEERGNVYFVTTEFSERHPIAKGRYKMWFQLVEVERAYYEIMQPNVTT